MLRKLLAVIGLVGMMLGLAQLPAQAVVPVGCTVSPGRFTVSPIPGAHNAVMVDTVAIVCGPSIGIVTERVRLLRYWVNSKTWTVERMRIYRSYEGAPGIHLAFYCNTPGALMGLLVEDRFWQNGVQIATKTYSGRTTALCPR